MKILMMIAAVLLVTAPLGAIAQEGDTKEDETTLGVWIQKAAELITTSNEAREAGIPEEDVAEVLEASREQGLSPEETEEVLDASAEAIEESGPVDNFGAFVQARLDEGLRGQELAAAIHEEHRKNGKGKGHAKGHGKDKGKGNKKDHSGHDHDHDRDHGGDDEGHDDDDDGHDHENQDKAGKKKKGK